MKGIAHEQILARKYKYVRQRYTPVKSDILTNNRNMLKMLKDII